MVSKWGRVCILPTPEVPPPYTVSAVCGKPAPETTAVVAVDSHVLLAVLHAPMAVEIASVTEACHLGQGGVVTSHVQETYFAPEVSTRSAMWDASVLTREPLVVGLYQILRNQHEHTREGRKIPIVWGVM